MKKDRRPTSAISSHTISVKEDVDPFEEDEVGCMLMVTVSNSNPETKI